MFRTTPLLYQQLSKEEFSNYRKSIVGFVNSDGEIEVAKKLQGVVLLEPLCYGFKPLNAKDEIYRVDISHIEDGKNKWEPFVISSTSKIIAPIYPNFKGISEDTKDCILTDKLFVYSLYVPSDNKIISGIETYDSTLLKKYEVREITQPTMSFETPNYLTVTPIKIISKDNKLCGFLCDCKTEINHYITCMMFREEIDFSECGAIMNPDYSMRLEIDNTIRRFEPIKKMTLIESDRNDRGLSIEINTSYLQLSSKKIISYVPDFCLKTKIINL